MRGWSNSVSRGARIAEGALWAGASLLVLTAHIGAAAWLRSEPPLVPSDNQPPAAIMIELAETPEAVMTEENEISPDQETADASQSAEKVETPEETPADEPVNEVTEAEPAPVKPEPVEEVVTEEPDPVENEILARLDKVEVPIPAVKSRPLEKKREGAKKPEKKRPVKPPRQEQATSKQATQAQAQTTQSSRNAGRQTASGMFSSQSPAKWQSRLMAHLERRKKYPAGAKSRGETGVAYVRFRIDDAGNVLAASLVRSSGYSELDQEVLSLVRRASPVPAPPAGANKTITAPVNFSVR